LADDKEILELCKSEQSVEEGFILLVKTYQQRIYWHIRRMVIYHDDADDVMQETWIKVWKGLGNFREDSRLFTWIYRIATNEALTFIKRKKRISSIPFDEGGEELSSIIDTAPLISGDEISKKLQKAVMQLPAKQRLIFNMKYFDEMKYEDISDVLGTTVGGLKASYHLAVKKIEKYLELD
jgi:RNA polymerase sigma-70 factor (ECF subfamily)